MDWVLFILLLIFALMWLVGELVPRAAPLAKVGQWLWVLLVTLVVSGLRVTTG